MPPTVGLQPHGKQSLPYERRNQSFSKKLLLFVIREGKSSISIELSARQPDSLKDVQPGYAGVNYQEFLQSL